MADDEKYDKTYQPGDEEEEEEDEDDELVEESEEEDEDVVETDSNEEFLHEENYHDRQMAALASPDHQLKPARTSKFRPRVLEVGDSEHELPKRTPLASKSIVEQTPPSAIKRTTSAPPAPVKSKFKSKSAVTSRKFTKVIINYFVRS